MAISAITFGELRFGANQTDRHEDDERLLISFVAVLAVGPFEEAAAGEYGAFGAKLSVRRNGFDLLIAAHALALGAILVTNNERDFADIPGLRVENWTR